MSTPTATAITTPCASSERQYQDKLLTDLFVSYYSARSNKRNTHNQVRFERNLSENLISLYHEILSRRYKVGRSICFIIERPVKREVFAASFRDRVVHHLLYNYLVPIFDPIFIYDSYSCRVGKGTLFGVQRLEHHIRSCSNNFTKECWVLKLDLTGYFMSMDRQRLYDIVISTLLAKGKDKEPEYPTMAFLLKQVIFNDPTKGCYVKGKRSDWEGLPPTKSLFHSREGCGLPIGNLTSQLFSNIYLNELDQYLKRVLKVKHYGRYVDDFYLVDNSKEKLLSLIEPIRKFLDEKLFLALHPKKIYLQRQEKGVQFLGCVVKNGHRYMSARCHKLMTENLARTYAFEPNPYLVRACVNSYKGYLSHMDRPDMRMLGLPY